MDSAKPDADPPLREYVAVCEVECPVVAEQDARLELETAIAQSRGSTQIPCTTSNQRVISIEFLFKLSLFFIIPVILVNNAWINPRVDIQSTDPKNCNNLNF